MAEFEQIPLRDAPDHVSKEKHKYSACSMAWTVGVLVVRPVVLWCVDIYMLRVHYASMCGLTAVVLVANLVAEPCLFLAIWLSGMFWHVVPALASNTVATAWYRVTRNIPSCNRFVIIGFQLVAALGLTFFGVFFYPPIVLSSLCASGVLFWYFFGRMGAVVLFHCLLLGMAVWTKIDRRDVAECGQRLRAGGRIPTLQQV